MPEILKVLFGNSLYRIGNSLYKTDAWGTHCRIDLWRMPQNHTNEKLNIGLWDGLVHCMGVSWFAVHRPFNRTKIIFDSFMVIKVPMSMLVKLIVVTIQSRGPWASLMDHYGYGLSQWETKLHCNVVSHWLKPYPKYLLLSTEFRWSRIDLDIYFALRQKF